MTGKNAILFSVLDWGLGHATRIIPVIRYFESLNYDILIAGYGNSFIVLKQEFPKAHFIELNGFTPKFSKSLPQWVKLLAQVPQFLKTIRKEHKDLKSLVALYSPCYIISDNRYGVWHPKITSIIITHQTNIELPKLFNIFSPLIHKIMHKWINKFDECWIPDCHLELSGNLSNNKGFIHNEKKIGLLSRFNHGINQPSDLKSIPILVLASGPEPQKSVFIKTISTQLKQLGKKATVVCGNPLKNEHSSDHQITYISHLNGCEMEQVIRNAEIIICRSGYSTIMDLIRLQKKALLVPTPGQTEQLLLAFHLQKRGFYKSVLQSKINLKDDLTEINLFSPPANSTNDFFPFNDFKLPKTKIY